MMNSKQIKQILNKNSDNLDFDRVQDSSAKSLDAMRNKSFYPTTRKFTKIFHIFINILLILSSIGFIVQGYENALIGIFVLIIGYILNRLSTEAVNIITDIADSSVTQVELLRNINKNFIK